MTLPMTTLPIAAASSPDRFSVSLTTAAPRSVAGIDFRDPLKAPIAVRTGLQRTMSCALFERLLFALLLLELLVTGHLLPECCATAPLVTCMIIVTTLCSVNAAQELWQNVVSDRPQPGTRGRVVEHAHHARRSGRHDALRRVSEEPRHRTQYAHATTECAGRGGAVGTPPLQHSPAA